MSLICDTLRHPKICTAASFERFVYYLLETNPCQGQ